MHATRRVLFMRMPRDISLSFGLDRIVFFFVVVLDLLLLIYYLMGIWYALCTVIVYKKSTPTFVTPRARDIIEEQFHD